MLTGVYAPIYNDYSDPARLVELAVAAEASGFDGFFV
jgi:alkanesulfonate monooxygenase SsuD/methylene tetrahydromethanopterin reductase-like flavin-dependent oxidoreductase (luciferase family)